MRKSIESKTGPADQTILLEGVVVHDLDPIFAVSTFVLSGLLSRVPSARACQPRSRVTQRSIDRFLMSRTRGWAIAPPWSLEPHFHRTVRGYAAPTASRGVQTGGDTSAFDYQAPKRRKRLTSQSSAPEPRPQSQQTRPYHPRNPGPYYVSRRSSSSTHRPCSCRPWGSEA